MTPDFSLNLRQCACRRAHLAGAEAARLQAAADAAKRRYFRELETCDLLGGYDSSFTPLG
jgi:hypothetical protein